MQPCTEPPSSEGAWRRPGLSSCKITTRHYGRTQIKHHMLRRGVGGYTSWYDGPMQLAHAGRHHRDRRGSSRSSRIRPVELPRLARPKGRCAARSIDELSGRIAGRLDSHTSGLLQATPSEGRHYDNLSSPQLPPDPFTISDDYGLDGAVGACAPPPLPQGQRDIPGTTGWMELLAKEAGAHRCKRMTRPCDLPGAGRRVSQMHGTRS